MIYQDFNPCPLCGAQGQTPYASCTDFMVSKESYTLMRCKSCGVVYTLDPPSEEDIRNYEKINLRSERADYHTGLTGRLYSRARNRMIKWKVRLVEKQSYRTNGTLLNYGAKTGHFSSRMEKRGWKVTSVERYHERRLLSLQVFHHRMIDLADMDRLHAGTFDVITLWHVFEHCYNPNELLDRFYQLLRPTGILIIACPNIRSTDSIHYGPYWAAYDVPRHLWHFNPGSISELAHRHGYTLMHHQRMPYDSFYISVLSEKHKRHRMAFIRGMIEGFKSWKISITRKSRASSVVYVFRKRQQSEGYDQTKEKEKD